MDNVNVSLILLMAIGPLVTAMVTALNAKKLNAAWRARRAARTNQVHRTAA